MHSQPEEFARRIDDFLISVGPATGRMLHLLATGGKVVSLELSQRKVDHATRCCCRSAAAWN